MIKSVEERSEGEPEASKWLSHQISGPLTSILIQCDLLLEEALAPAARQRLEAIRAEALRISHHLRASQQA